MTYRYRSSQSHMYDYSPPSETPGHVYVRGGRTYVVVLMGGLPGTVRGSKVPVGIPCACG